MTRARAQKIALLEIVHPFEVGGKEHVRGAPASICLASTELAAGEDFTCTWDCCGKGLPQLVEHVRQRGGIEHQYSLLGSPSRMPSRKASTNPAQQPRSPDRLFMVSDSNPTATSQYSLEHTDTRNSYGPQLCGQPGYDAPLRML